ncbi:tyrosine--tRNA ligase, partial [Clostridium saudiense]|nr:tyrosine--tRNA ligase [Clostridium saudiense]
ADIVLSNNLVPSKKEFRRLVDQGGVKINGERISNIDEISLESELIIQIGKKKFIKIIIS